MQEDDYVKALVIDGVEVVRGETLKIDHTNADQYRHIIGDELANQLKRYDPKAVHGIYTRVKENNDAKSD